MEKCCILILLLPKVVLTFEVLTRERSFSNASKISLIEDRFGTFLSFLQATTSKCVEKVEEMTIYQILNKNDRHCTLGSSKWILLNYIRDRNDFRTMPVGTYVMPCTQKEYGGTVGEGASLRFDPWSQAIAARPGPTPIAKIYVPRPRSNTVDEAVVPRLPPAAPLWHGGGYYPRKRHNI